MRVGIRVAAAIAAGLFCASPGVAGEIGLSLVTRHSTGIFDKSAAEIPAFHPASARLFVVNGAAPSVDILKLDGTSLSAVGTLALDAAESPTSVAIHDDLVAVAAYDPEDPQWSGRVIFFSIDGKRLKVVEAGSMPDMVTFTRDGRYVLTADEGERSDSADPEGGVTIIDLARGVAGAKARQADFRGFDIAGLKAKGVRIFPDAPSAAQDLEPEYIATASDGRRAWVTLQENNAIAEVDIAAARVTDIWALGVKDHSLPGNGLDASSKDGARIENHRLFGLYMPDAMAAYGRNGTTYLVTANEGDSRKEDVKLGKAKTAPGLFTAAESKTLEKLEISAIDGDRDGDGLIDDPHVFGARSFSIWSTDGKQLFDSGDQFERITAERLGGNFNSDNDESGSGDKRSPKKGPEPEGIAVGEIDGRTYAFVGLERTGGIMVYDITDPKRARFVDYQVDRAFSSELDYERPQDLAKAGDLGPEGLIFVGAAGSPTGTPLLIVASEVSGTVTAYSVTNR